MSLDKEWKTVERKIHVKKPNPMVKLYLKKIRPLSYFDRKLISIRGETFPFPCRWYKDGEFGPITYMDAPLSSYIWNFKQTVVSNNDINILAEIPDDNWILGILHNTGNDLQIGCSGKCYLNEKPEDTACRELSEELGLVPRGSFKKFSSPDPLYKKYYIFLIDVKSVEPTKNIKAVRGQDDGTQRVFMIVHGKKEDVLSKLESLTCVRKSDDSPRALAAIPKIIVSKAVTYIRTQIKDYNKLANINWREL